MDTELDYDYELLINAVQKAGTIAKKFFGKTKKQWKKNLGEPVSEVDIKINQSKIPICLSYLSFTNSPF